MILSPRHQMAVSLTSLVLVPWLNAQETASPKHVPLAAEQLHGELARQHDRIVQLERMVEQQGLLLERLRERLGEAHHNSSTSSRSSEIATESKPDPSSRGSQAEAQQYTKRIEDLDQKLEGALRNLGGFRLSGDFRYRFDIQARSGNAAAGPLQNVRNRYRMRLNIDKELDARFRFHMQLSTAPLNNAITNDQDFGATVAKHPFSIAEAYIDFHPHANFSSRVGRMEEIFADNTRFLWDDDVRFNGFHQTFKIPLRTPVMGIKSIEFRAAEYILSNPNIAILAPGSPFVSAGFLLGKKVRAANLFHPGAVLHSDFGKQWKQQFITDIQIYRNANQIQLASLANGFPVVISNSLGIALAGPMTGTGNATSTPGGAMFKAPHFQIARLAYRLEHTGLHIGDRQIPAWLDVQVSRNTGTSRLRDAIMASVNIGAVRRAGETRFLYQFAIKDANSLISQFTDDDLGTGSGVNIAVHALRFDLGLTRFLQWQNLFFIQNQRRANNPVEQFFVPLPRGANSTFRYLGQLAFAF